MYKCPPTYPIIPSLRPPGPLPINLSSLWSFRTGFSTINFILDLIFYLGDFSFRSLSCLEGPSALSLRDLDHNPSNRHTPVLLSHTDVTPRLPFDLGILPPPDSSRSGTSETPDTHLKLKTRFPSDDVSLPSPWTKPDPSTTSGVPTPGTLHEY